MKKSKAFLLRVKNTMIDALEVPEKQTFPDGSKHIILTGEFVTHDDIPEETPLGYDDHFAVYGEEDEPMALVCIKVFTQKELSDGVKKHYEKQSN